MTAEWPEPLFTGPASTVLSSSVSECTLHQKNGSSDAICMGVSYKLDVKICCLVYQLLRIPTFKKGLYMFM